jgi:hypothetical protein
MAHQNSNVPIGSTSTSQSYLSTRATQGSSLQDNGKSLASAAMTTIYPNQPRHFSQLWSNIQVVLFAVIPMIVLITWLGYIRANPRIFDTFAGEKIGGHLSQAKAKAIDVIAVIIIAPLLMAALNHIWLSSARVLALNKQQHKFILFGR